MKKIIILTLLMSVNVLAAMETINSSSDNSVSTQGMYGRGGYGREGRRGPGRSTQTERQRDWHGRSEDIKKCPATVEEQCQQRRIQQILNRTCDKVSSCQLQSNLFNKLCQAQVEAVKQYCTGFISGVPTPINKPTTNV